MPPPSRSRTWSFTKESHVAEGHMKMCHSCVMKLICGASPHPGHAPLNLRSGWRNRVLLNLGSLTREGAFFWILMLCCWFLSFGTNFGSDGTISNAYGGLIKVLTSSSSCNDQYPNIVFYFQKQEIKSLFLEIYPILIKSFVLILVVLVSSDLFIKFYRTMKLIFAMHRTSIKK